MKQLYGIDDPKLESQLRKTAAARALRGRSSSLRVLACSVAVGILIALVVLTVGLLGLGSAYMYVGIFLASAFALGPVRRFLFRRTEDKALHSTLKEASRCEGCGYDLRNTGIQPCPECGHDGQEKGSG